MEIKHCKMFEPLKVKETETVEGVAKKLRDSKVRHAYVVNSKGAPVGVISVVDISNRVVAEGKSAKEMKAKDIMSAPVETKDVNDSIKDAYELMVKGRRYSLAITKEGKLFGILPMNEAVGVMLGKTAPLEKAIEGEKR
jgi:CBS domain-containing protein